MKKLLGFILLLLFFSNAQGQEELNFPTVKYGVKDITANWVNHPDINGGEDAIVLFRNPFEVDNPNDDFIINISADNHYFLYVNGQIFTHGPQLSTGSTRPKT